MKNRCFKFECLVLVGATVMAATVETITCSSFTMAKPTTDGVVGFTIFYALSGKTVSSVVVAFEGAENGAEMTREKSAFSSNEECRIEILRASGERTDATRSGCWFDLKGSVIATNAISAQTADLNKYIEHFKRGSGTNLPSYESFKAFLSLKDSQN
jgi:hypothetical protein